MTKVVFLFIFCLTKVFNQGFGDENSTQVPDHLQDLKATMADMVKKSSHDIARMRHIDAKSRKDVAYEIGHLYCIIFDKYRMMVSRYNQSLSMPPHHIWNMELLLNLDAVASLYFEIVHLKGMMREVERKYAFNALVHGDYDLIATTTATSTSNGTINITSTPIVYFQRRNRTKIPRHVLAEKNRYTKDWKEHHKTRHYWPNFTYGWEPLYDWNYE